MRDDYTAITLKRNSENFLVARLLPVGMRQGIHTYYHFCRAVDDIADDPVRSAEDKRRILGIIDGALSGTGSSAFPWLEDVNLLVRQGKCDIRHPRYLLEAMYMDCDMSRYSDYKALVAYCDRSAASVGRAVLDICGETGADREAVAALCIALQLLNHLQDIASDYTDLDRVYLPQNWLNDAGVNESMLAAPAMTPALRLVVNQLLDVVDTLNTEAKRLPASIQNWRLRIEAGAIVAISMRLSYKLRREDMLHARVALRRVEVLQCVARGLKYLW